MTPLLPLIKDNNSPLEDHSILIGPRNAMNVSGLSLSHSWLYKIKEAAVIQGPDQQGAIDSAVKLNLTVTEFESYNLINHLPAHYQKVEIKNIIVPSSYNNTNWVNQIRIMNHRLDYQDVTRIFNHMTVWYHCITQGAPIIVLESNARLKSAPESHLPRSSIIGLDTDGEFYCYNTNYRVMPGVWAYSIDQFAAQRMFALVLTQGLRDPLELMFRADQRLILLQNHAYKVSL
jgi:hypothetical protein